MISLFVQISLELLKKCLMELWIVKQTNQQTNKQTEIWINKEKKSKGVTDFGGKKTLQVL